MNNINIPQDVQFILDTLDTQGHSAYIVGGCVRDYLLGKIPKDWDICTSAHPDEIKSCFNEFKTIDTGIKHGTVTLVLSENHYEITTYRVESEYSDGRHPSNVTFTDSIIEDLSRRDFTMNAIAYNHKVGILDPYHGMDDLLYKRIYCVNDPDERFNEDGLRILRALRFAATYGFNISPDVKASIFRNITMLNKISKERINSELCKIISGQFAATVLTEYKHVFAYIIPELNACIGFNQNNPYHIFDVYDHMMYALDNYSGSDIIVRLSLFLHDIGKPKCYSEDERGGHFYGHGSVCAEEANKILKYLKFDNDTITKVTQLIKYHDSTIVPSAKVVKRWLTKMSKDQLSRLLDIRKCDILAHSGLNQHNRIAECEQIKDILDNIVEQDSYLTLHRLNISGNDIMNLGIPQGPRIGQILNECLSAVINEQTDNTYESLIDYVKEII